MANNPLNILNLTPDEVKRFQTLRITEMAHIAKCEETLENLGFLPQLNEKTDIGFLLDLIERALKTKER